MTRETLACCLMLLAPAAGRAAGPEPQPAPLPLPAPVPAIAAPVLQAASESVPRSLRDSGGRRVEFRVPAALYRPANAFRLYGTRPLTLWSRGRRRDLYRDAFLELATRARLSPRVTAWDSVLKQLRWLGPGGVPLPPGLPGLPADTGALDDSELARRATELARQVVGSPGYRHLEVFSRALGQSGLLPADGRPPLLAEPVMATLQLRALATDAAEHRLRLLGAALGVEEPGRDPALRDGYRAARAEFDTVRRALWPAIAASVRKNQGRLLLDAGRQLALSHLGLWAIFGYLGWQGVEGVLTAEFHGQYAVCLATLAAGLQSALPPPPAEGAAGPPEAFADAVYAEYSLNLHLTEALKWGQMFELKPAGGKSAPDWQIRCGTRCGELRRWLLAATTTVPPAAPAGEAVERPAAVEAEAAPPPG